MGWFEEYPWLLIPIIIVTVEVWNVVKGAVRKIRNEERERGIR